MPTIILEDVPTEVYERLQQRASDRHRSIPDELLAMLRQALHGQDPGKPRLPDFLGSEEQSPLRLAALQSA